ncbi:MAG: hypothetical protein V3T72_09850, partial [Thermoanaerobaculia bacterium]
WIFFGLLAVALYRFRRRPELRREYSLWGYPVIPAVFMLSAFAIVANQIAASPGESLQGLGLVLIGLPVYVVWNRFSKNPSSQESAR